MNMSIFKQICLTGFALLYFAGATNAESTPLVLKVIRASEEFEMKIPQSNGTEPFELARANTQYFVEDCTTSINEDGETSVSIEAGQRWVGFKLFGEYRDTGVLSVTLELRELLDAISEPTSEGCSVQIPVIKKSRVVANFSNTNQIKRTLLETGLARFELVSDE